MASFTADLSTPQGAILSYDAALRAGDVEGALAAVALNVQENGGFKYSFTILPQEHAYRRPHFLEEIQLKGLAVFARDNVQFVSCEKGDHFANRRQLADYRTVRRTAAIPGIGPCEEEFKVVRVAGKWKVLNRTALEFKTVHPVLGPVEYKSGFWRFPGNLPWIGWDVTFSIRTEEQGLSDEQVEDVLTVCRYPHDLRMEIAQRIYDMYQEYIYGSFTSIDEFGVDHAEEVAPPISEPEEIWKLLHPPQRLRVHKRKEGKLFFNLDTGCTFDDEHGLGMRFLDWKFVEFTNSGA